MHHGCHHEFQREGAQLQRVALFHLDVALFNAIESLHHAESLLVSDDFHVGIVFLQQGNRAAVVGLHVVHHEVVHGSLADDFADVFEILREEIHLHSVDEARFLVHQQVGVVGNAVWQRPETLEQRLVAVVHAYVVDVFCDGFHVDILVFDDFKCAKL